jgi:putative hydrolase of the HAD superfamily
MPAPLVLSFDLDDTLWPIEPVIVAAEQELESWLRLHHPRVMRAHDSSTLRAIREQVRLENPEHGHDMTFLRHRAIMTLFGEGSVARRHADEAFEVFYAARNRVTLYDDVLAALERLRQRYRLFALSNGNADLERCGLSGLFEGHITAIAAGASKPDARIFTHLERSAGVDAAQVLHIGDDPHADVNGAASAGMQAVWLNRDAKQWPAGLPPPARTISTLAQIL